MGGKACRPSNAGSSEKPGGGVHLLSLPPLPPSFPLFFFVNSHFRCGTSCSHWMDGGEHRRGGKRCCKEGPRSPSSRPLLVPPPTLYAGLNSHFPMTDEDKRWGGLSRFVLTLCPLFLFFFNAVHFSTANTAAERRQTDLTYLPTRGLLERTSVTFYCCSPFAVVAVVGLVKWGRGGAGGTWLCL